MAPAAFDQRELGHLMFRKNGTRALIETIDDAIEQAEKLGLAFVADVLMMARLEAVQADSMRLAEPGNDGPH